MNGEIKVLQVDDDEIDIRLAKRALAKYTGPSKFNIDSAGTLADAVSHIKNNHLSQPYDVVLLDLGLPDSNGIETVKAVCKANPNIPIVVLTGLEDEQTGLSAIQNGASDYLVKGPVMESSLVKTVLYAIERKKAAEKLRESQQMLQVVMDSVPQAIFWKDHNLSYIGCNAVFARHAGFSSPQEVIGKNDFQLPWRKEEAEYFRQSDLRIMSSNKGEYHMIESQLQADGKQAWVEVNKVPLCNSAGQTVGVLGTYEDITERLQAERALQIAEERYRTIFENSAVAIMMADENERLVSWNKFTENLLGMTKDDLYHKQVRSLYPESEWDKIRTHDVRQKGMQHHLETKMTKKDGDIIDVDVSLSVVKDPESRIIGSIGVIRDITERKEAENKIKEAMDLKSQFISTVSHELRTPLTIIKEDIALIMDGAAGRVKSKQKEILSIAQRNIDRLSRLINDVLDFQKLQSGRAKFNMQDNSINGVIETVYNTMLKAVKKNGVDFRLALDGSLPRTTFDSDKMIQVLTNLVSNAMKFTEKGGITISTRRIENSIRVTVADTGCGIKQEDLSKLFQQFQQLASSKNRKTGGTGLGLAISKDIVEKHGGRIWVESEFGKGTSFHFLLPIKSADVPEPEKAPQLNGQK
ncbi:MAG: PAS domain S-box protein [Sedimentisphaerales bacterium]|nr:PAS domain S-box protein [Sedimentisphaerales bacterium]